ncbi:cadherin-like beta sandwich domain-containing protein, partial [Adhaeribacter soli]
VAIGDIDGDGKPDLAIANNSSNTVSVLRNTGSSGTVNFAPKADFTTVTNPYSVAIGDIDGDGKPDLAIANSNSNSNNVSVLRNIGSSGTVSFAAKADFVTGSSPFSVAIGDIDGDGKPDLAIANINAGSVSVFRNIGSSGTISFAAKVDFTTGSSARSVAIGDIDGDGKPDLAITNNSSNTVSVLRNNPVILSANANLSALTLSSGTLAPAFAAATASYTASVANATTSITVTPTKAEANATITVNGTAVTSGSASGAIALNVGSNTITTVVTAQDGTTTKTYSVVVNRAYSPPGNALHFDGANDYVEGPAIAATSIKTMEAWVKFGSFSGTQEILSKSVNDSGFELVTVGSNLCFYAMNSASNFSFITYPAIGNLETGKWYHIAVTWDGTSRASMRLYVNGIAVGARTDVGNLTSVSNPAGNFRIGAWYGYDIRYFNGAVDEVRVWSTNKTQPDIQAGMLNAISPSATGLLAYYNFDNGAASGSNAGLTNLTDLSPNGRNGTLTNFTLSGATSNWVESYAMVVPVVAAASNISATSFTANWSAPAVGTVTNYLLDVSTNSAFSTFVSGYSSRNVGTATSSAVTGLSPSTPYYYRVRADKTSVTGQGANSGTTIVTTLSNNANLSALAISSGTLNPTFASATTSYTASVTNATTSITVTPTVAESNATITVNGTTVTSGSASAAIALNVGSNTITTVVTAQDGTTIKTYIVTVTKAEAAPVITLQPATIAVTGGQPAGFTVVATGNGTLSYQWQVSTDGGTTFNNLGNGGIYSGTTTNSLAISNAPISLSGYQYRAIVSNGTAVNSSGAALTVTMPAFNNNRTWIASGTPGFSTVQASYTSMAINAAGTPYIAFLEGSTSKNVMVMKQTGSGWQAVGTTGFPATSGAEKSLELVLDAAGLPYIIYQDASYNGKLTVKKFDGTNWLTVGSAGFSAGQAYYPSLVLDASGKPYAAYMDNTNNYKATVKKLNGSLWETVGTVGFTTDMAWYISLALDPSGTPYLAFQDGASGDKATVMKFNGTTWQAVGTAGFSAGTTYYNTLVLDAAGTPYVAYVDVINGNKVTVMKFNGSAWASVGTAGISAGAAQYISLALDAAGTPYVGYTDASNSSKATVMKFNGAAWATVGTSGFSLGAATFTSLALDASGMPYLAYRDGGNATKATVMKFAASDNANLSALTLSSGTLSPVFASATASYTASVPNATTSITVTPTKAEANATITVNGTAVTSGNASVAIALNIGSNTITTVVTAQDGTTTKTYSVVVNRAYSPPGNALHFAGNQHVEAANSATINQYVSTGQLTVEYWVRPVNQTASLATTISHRGDANNNGFVMEGNNAGWDHWVNFSGNWYKVTFPYTSNIWQHIAIVAQNGQPLKGYLNGELVATTPTSGAMTFNSNALRIGNNTQTNVNRYFSGAIDELRIYSTALSQAQVKADMLNTTAAVPASLNLHYDFDNGIAGGTNTGINTVSDLSGNGNTGSLANFALTGSSSNWVESYAMVVPTATATTAIGSTGFTVNWTAPAIGTVTNYLLDVSTNSTFTALVSGYNGKNAGTATSEAITGLLPATTYYYRVRAAKTSVTGQGAYSATIMAKTLSNNANLSALSLSAGTLNPVFASATTAYSASVINTTTSITVTPTVFESNATITVNGTAVTSGSASGPIALNVGNNTITTVVTAQDGSTTKTYTISVTRTGSANANLANLTLSSGTLSPAFNSNTASYTASVANAVTSITVTPTVDAPFATVKVSGTTVVSGNPSGAIALAVGSNSITVEVTAQNNTTKTYTIAITRAAPGTSIWNGSASTSWNDPNNWSPVGVPTSTSTATIPSGVTPPVITSGTISLTNLIVNTGTSFTVAGGTFNLSGNITNNGNFAQTGGTFNLNGTTSQAIGGTNPVTFFNLTVGMNNAVMNTDVNVQGVLTLTGSIATAGHVLTLLSNASGTAMIVNSGGVVNGNITMQRFIDASVNTGAGYRHFSSPVQNTTVADFTTSGFAPVVNPVYNTAANPASVKPYPNVMSYNQNRIAATNATTSDFTFGWQSPGALTDVLAPGKGYTVNLKASSKVDLVGAPNNGNVTLTNLNTGGQANSGWHLLGNPYPSPIAIDRFAVPAGFYPAVHTFRSTGQYAGSYASYVNGVGSIPDGILPAMQGFFMQCTTNVASFMFTNAMRVTSYSNPSFYRVAADTRPLLTLRLANSLNEADEAFVYLENGATTGFEGNMDAVKLPGGNVSLYTMAGTEALSINGIGTTASQRVPLAVSGAAGNLVISVERLVNFSGYDGVLEDKINNSFTTLSAASVYSFSHTGGVVANRFVLHINARVSGTNDAMNGIAVNVYPNPTSAEEGFTLVMQGLTTSKLTASLYNSLGQEVQTRHISVSGGKGTEGFSTARLAKGIYTLSLTSGTARSVRKIIVQ